MAAIEGTGESEKTLPLFRNIDENREGGNFLNTPLDEAQRLASQRVEHSSISAALKKKNKK